MGVQRGFCLLCYVGVQRGFCLLCYVGVQRGFCPCNRLEAAWEQGAQESISTQTRHGQGDEENCIMRNIIIFNLSKIYKIINFSFVLHWRPNWGGGVDRYVQYI